MSAKGPLLHFYIRLRSVVGQRAFELHRQLTNGVPRSLWRLRQSLVTWFVEHEVLIAREERS